MLGCDTFWNETNICEQRSNKMRNKKRKEEKYISGLILCISQ